MKRLALALLLFATGAHAQPKTAPSTLVPDAPPTALDPIDRTAPASERRRLESATPEERGRVVARASATSAHSDEALALLVYAAGRAQAFQLREADLQLVVRGLAARPQTKPARDALFALLSARSSDGRDTLAPHQHIAATALARGAEYADPEPVEAPLDPARPRPTVVAKPRPDTLGKLLELAEEPRLEATITAALRRHPPRKPPPAPTGPAFFRIGAALGDLRWIPALDFTLRDPKSPEPVLLAALHAASELGDGRSLARIVTLAGSTRPAVALAATEAWATLDPVAGGAAAERMLLRPGAPPLALVRFARSPQALQSVAERLGRAPTDRAALRALALLPGGAGVPALVRLAGTDDSMHAAIDALGLAPFDAATEALGTLLRDRRPVARHEAAHTLLSRALEPEPYAPRARATLRRAHADRVALPQTIQAWLAGRPTPRARAALTLVATVHDGTERSLTDLAECARGLRIESATCAFAFGKALPRSLDERRGNQLAELLAIDDPSVHAELLDGLARGAWPGAAEVIAQALVEANDRPLRRRIAALAQRLIADDPSARGVLTRAITSVAWAEPDLRTARLLEGRTEAPTRSTHLIRADADGQLRCGYARDELGTVLPFVLEDGAALVEGVVGQTLEATFTRCDDSVLSARPMR